jgi:hypothetical protein
MLRLLIEISNPVQFAVAAGALFSLWAWIIRVRKRRIVLLESETARSLRVAATCAPKALHLDHAHVSAVPSLPSPQAYSSLTGENASSGT